MSTRRENYLCYTSIIKQVRLINHVKWNWVLNKHSVQHSNNNTLYKASAQCSVFINHVNWKCFKHSVYSVQITIHYTMLSKITLYAHYECYSCLSCKIDIHILFSLQLLHIYIFSLIERMEMKRCGTLLWNLQRIY